MGQICGNIPSKSPTTRRLTDIHNNEEQQLEAETNNLCQMEGLQCLHVYILHVNLQRFSEDFIGFPPKV